MARSDEQVRLRVRAFFPEDQRLADGDPSAAFWARALGSRERTQERYDDVFAGEYRLQHEFGLALYKLLIRHFSLLGGEPFHPAVPKRVRVVDKAVAPERADLLAGVFFQASIIGYGSLDFDVAIAGVDKLAALFDNNFELFEMFLTTYIPAAFADAVGVDPLSLPLFDLTVPEATKAHFVAAPATVTAGDSAGVANEKARRARWAWVVSNTSLVVPVTLAVLILFVAFSAVARERVDLLERTVSLSDRALALEAVSAQRATELYKLNCELLAREASATATAAR